MQQYLTVRDVAKKLKLKEYTIRDWCKKGKLDAEKIGHVWRIRDKLPKNMNQNKGV